MILCRYFDECGEDPLRNLRLKVNNPSRFNDPFENSAYVEGNEIQYKDLKKYFKDPKTIDRLYKTHRNQIGGKNKREFKRNFRLMDKRRIFERVSPTLPGGLRDGIQEYSKKFSKICRVLCFSNPDRIKPHEEILMWSHYSKGHAGVRVFFDTDKFGLLSKGPFRIEYQRDRVALDLGKIVVLDSEVFEEFGRSLTVKSSAWAYEYEYRWLIHIKECISERINGKVLDFIKIPPEAIVRVDIGVKCSQKFKSKVTELLKKDQFMHVGLRVARLNEKRFQLNYVKLNKK